MWQNLPPLPFEEMPLSWKSNFRVHMRACSWQGVGLDALIQSRGIIQYIVWWFWETQARPRTRQGTLNASWWSSENVCVGWALNDGHLMCRATGEGGLLSVLLNSPRPRWVNHKHQARWQVWLLYLLTWPDLKTRDVVDCKRFKLTVLTGACFASSVAETPVTTNTPGISVPYAS